MQRPLITYFIFILLLSFGAKADDLFTEKADKFLSADEAFQLGDVSQDSLGNLNISLNIADGHYLYKSKTLIRNIPSDKYTYYEAPSLA